MEIVRGLFDLCTMLNSHHKLNSIRFKSFCDNLMHAYITNTSTNYYPMPTSLHKILVHGPEVVDSFVLPIGQLSEEALEANHKNFKRFRRDHSRKFSRVQTNTDIMNWLLLTTDPLINRTRPFINKGEVIYSDRVKDILEAENVNLDD